LIDFGFSSIHLKQQTGFSFMLISPNDECGWIKTKDIYYPEKDVLQFLLSSLFFELEPKAESFRTFVLNLGYAYDPEPYYKVIDKLVKKHSKTEFNLGYNYDLKLRIKLKNKLGKSLETFRPVWLLEHFDTILKSFKDFDTEVNKNKRTIMPIVKGGSHVNEWGTSQPKKSLFQRMKNKMTRKKNVINSKPPKKSLRQRVKNLFTRKNKKVVPAPNNKPNNMRYKTNNTNPTTASNPEINEKIHTLIQESQNRYLENHPRTGFTAPFARKQK
jgi:hypothetical protein